METASISNLIHACFCAYICKMECTCKLNIKIIICTHKEGMKDCLINLQHDPNYMVEVTDLQYLIISS